MRQLRFSATCSSRWLFRKVSSVTMGNARMSLVVALQIAPVMGTRYRSLKAVENL